MAFEAKKEETNYSIVPVDRVREGVHLVTDDGFTCMRDHEIKLVKYNIEGELYVECDEGEHNLAGQECNPGEHGVDYAHYIGFWIKGEEPPK